MSAPRGHRLCALWILCLALAGSSTPASAEFYDASRRSLDLSPDPILRSPALVGMGWLTLAAAGNNGLSLWDFARNPAGLLDADSVSVIEARPSTASADGVRDLMPGGSFERQLVGGRETRTDFELWRRTENGNAYGFQGRVGAVSSTRPFDGGTMRNAGVFAPEFAFLFNGKMPYFRSERMRYAFRLVYQHEDQSDVYRRIVANAVGEYVDLHGDQVKPPDDFTPDEYQLTGTGLGAGVSYRFGDWLQAGLMADYLQQKLRGANEDVRHSSGTGEDRPYGIGQASLSGRIGRNFEWVSDGRYWRVSNEERWVFSIAAGIQQQPLAGRGLRLKRNEEGSTMRHRVRLGLGPLELGGSAETRYREVDVAAPRADDLTSFNYFLNSIDYRQNADSLVIPDSVRSNVSDQRDVAFVGGMTWKLPRGRAGAEVHWERQRFDATFTGGGPERRVWDVRAGVEYPCSSVLTARLGYFRRSDDRDRFTERNEWLSNGLTVGAGIRPRASAWTVESGYSIEWLQPDYADPYEARESRQYLAMQVRWVF